MECNSGYLDLGQSLKPIWYLTDQLNIYYVQLYTTGIYIYIYIYIYKYIHIYIHIIYIYIYIYKYIYIYTGSVHKSKNNNIYVYLQCTTVHNNYCVVQCTGFWERIGKDMAFYEGKNAKLPVSSSCQSTCKAITNHLEIYLTK